MLKWIIGIFLFYVFLGIGFWYFSSAKPISKQIDVKTMSFTNPNFIFKKYSICNGTCKNYSSSNSSWGGGLGGK